jgi:ABC-type lipoprotein export system ATPase subunit
MTFDPDQIVLKTEGLCKNYRSGPRDIHVLQGVDLELRAGETISIRGESGSGKSTLLNLLAGIETPDAGSVTWNNTSLTEIPVAKRPAVRASYLGFVFQSFYLIPELNTLDNVLLAARINGLSMKEGRARAELLLGELGLAERLESRPEQLSGGERQRTAIARALINQPEVIFADEPTGNLDEHTAERVMDQLVRVVEMHKAALILVTHHPGFASRASRQMKLVDGVLV